MYMTHIAEIGTKNWYQKTITVMKIEQCPVCYRKPVQEKFSTKLHVRRSTHKPVSVPISGTCVIGISLPKTVHIL